MLTLKDFCSYFQALAEARIDDKVMADGYGKKIYKNNITMFSCLKKYKILLQQDLALKVKLFIML